MELTTVITLPISVSCVFVILNLSQQLMKKYIYSAIYGGNLNSATWRDKKKCKHCISCACFMTPFIFLIVADEERKVMFPEGRMCCYHAQTNPTPQGRPPLVAITSYDRHYSIMLPLFCSIFHTIFIVIIITSSSSLCHLYCNCQYATIIIIIIIMSA